VKLTTIGTQGPPGPPGDKATQAEAEAGTDDTAYMTPLKTAQAVAAAPVGAATQTALDAETQARTATDTAEATARAAGDALKVAKAGDVMTGVLTAPGLVVNGTGPGPAGYAITVPSPGAAFGSNFNYLNLNSGWGPVNFNIWGAALGIMGGGFSALTLAGSIYVDKNKVIGISSGTAFSAVPDIAHSRLGPAAFALGNGTTGDDSGQLWLAGVRKKPRLVSQLPTPTSSIAGLEMVVSDASAPAYRDALSAGGGSDVVGARCTGSDWRAC
jgi:hypothetical protein